MSHIIIIHRHLDPMSLAIRLAKKVGAQIYAFGAIKPKNLPNLAQAHL
ncbi:MAG: hypothetical protein QMB16_01490 [Paracoccaceae bacterium]